MLTVVHILAGKLKTLPFIPRNVISRQTA